MWPGACERCLARSWLEATLCGHLDLVRTRIHEVLDLGEDELIDAVGGDRKQELKRFRAAFDVAAARECVAGAGLESVCGCDPRYPPGLAGLRRAPALYVAGGLERCLALLGSDPVAIVGARRASAYGLDVAQALGRGLASSGVTVISGMAFGIDSAAHAGALAGAGATVAVLPGSADRPYPASKRKLHREIVVAGAAVSALPPGREIRRWMFPARNRIIAALSAITVVVEAGMRSGSLVTARCANELGRPVGAVPGQVTAPRSAGPNALLVDGARVVRDAQDLLDALFGAGLRTATIESRSDLDLEQSAVLAEVANGHDSAEALARAGVPPERGLAVLASLELAGYIRKGAGGRFTVVPGV
jgi:DNA processing protein